MDILFEPKTARLEFKTKLIYHYIIICFTAFLLCLGKPTTLLFGTHPCQFKITYYRIKVMWCGREDENAFLDNSMQ